MVAWLALMPAQLIISNGGDVYRKTGRKAPIQEFAFNNLPRGFERAAARTVALSALGVMGSLIVFTLRWNRRVRRTKSNIRLTNAMFFQDTAHRSFWSKPEVAVFLLPDEPDRSQEPTAARDLASAINTAVSRWTGDSASVGAIARAAAASLSAGLTKLDQEIASLGEVPDPAEIDRLAAKIQALGPPHGGEGGAKTQMRDLLQKQIELHRGVDARIEKLKAQRSRQHDLLRALWQQALALRAAASDPGRLHQSSERLRSLCTEIESGLGGLDTQAATEAISDAPTIERR